MSDCTKRRTSELGVWGLFLEVAQEDERVRGFGVFLVDAVTGMSVYNYNRIKMKTRNKNLHSDSG